MCALLSCFFSNLPDDRRLLWSPWSHTIRMSWCWLSPLAHCIVCTLCFDHEINWKCVVGREFVEHLGAAHWKRHMTSKFSIISFFTDSYRGRNQPIKSLEKTEWWPSYGTFFTSVYMYISFAWWLWSRFSQLCGCGRCAPFLMSLPKMLINSTQAHTYCHWFCFSDSSSTVLDPREAAGTVDPMSSAESAHVRSGEWVQKRPCS